MTIEEKEEFLAAYNTWVLRKKMRADDVSPSAYILDQAKQDALDRVVEAMEYIGFLTVPLTEHLENLSNILSGMGDQIKEINQKE